jgi:deoxycytidine triphosphate deaminase
MANSATPPGAVSHHHSVRFLTDDDILALLERNELIRPKTWHRDNIRHASYTLRVGVKASVKRARSGTNGVAQARVEEVSIDAATPLVLSPGDIAMVYGQEHLQLPADMIGLTVARGLLFSSGLGPENTYIDPGFDGLLYITLHNHTAAEISIPHLTSLARVFFYRLAKRVGTPYTNGGGLGIPQSLPLKTLVEHDRNALGQLSFQELISSLSNDLIIGDTSAEIVRRVHRQWILMMCLIPPAVALCLLAQHFTDGIKFTDVVGVFRDLPDWAKTVANIAFPQLVVVLVCYIAGMAVRALRLLWRSGPRE